MNPIVSQDKDNLTLLKEKFKNEKNNICQKFINALNECIEKNNNAIEVYFPPFNLIGNTFDLRECLDKNNQITIKNNKFNVKFKSDTEHIAGNTFTNHSNIIPHYRIKRHIKLIKNENYQIKIFEWIYGKESDFKFIVSE